MFYSSFVFLKKGPLAKLWIAAFTRKLKKADVDETDIRKAVHALDDPGAPLALRMSAPLLLGLVRIYERKATYLQDEATEIIAKSKRQQRAATGVSGRAAIDLPSGTGAASSAINLSMPEYEQIMLPIENYDLDALLQEAGGYTTSMLGSESTGDVAIRGTVSYSGERGRFSIEQARNIEDVSAELQHMAGFDEQLPEDTSIFDEPSVQQALRQSVAPSEYDIEVGRDADISMADPMAVDLGGDNLFLQPQKQGETDMSRISLIGMPEDAAVAPGTPERPVPQPAIRRRKRLAGIKIDEQTTISSRVMQQGLLDTSDITHLTGRPFMSFSSRRQILDTLREADGLARLLRLSFQEFAHLPHDNIHQTEQVEAPELRSLLQQQIDALLNQSQHEMPPEEPSRPSVRAAFDADEQVFDIEPQQDFPFEPSQRYGEEEVEEEKVAEAPEPRISRAPLLVDETVEVRAARQEQEAEQMREEFADDEQRARAAHEYFNEPAAAGPETEAPAQTEETEQRFSNRAVRMHALLAKQFKQQKTDSLSLNQLLSEPAINRNTAAGVFYQLLVLKSHDVVGLQQTETYGDIHIQKTNKFPARLQASRGR